MADNSLQKPGELSVEAYAQGQLFIALLTQLVEPLAAALPASTEVVLHDLSRLPNSIVAIAGNVTGRKVGDPATDVLLRYLRTGDESGLTRYRTELSGRREGRSTTMILRLTTGEPIAALCLNTDVTEWRAAFHLIESHLLQGGRAAAASVEVIDEQAVSSAVEVERPSRGEAFVRNVDELAETLIGEAIAAVGVPVDLMKKHHKVQVVADLEMRGMFMIRDAVENVAAALGVSRYTIYNYLNELAADREAVPAAGLPEKPRTSSS